MAPRASRSVGVGQHLFEIAFEQLPGLAGEHLRQRVAPGGDVRFDGVRQGVDAGQGGHLGRLRQGHFRIENGDAKGGLAIAAGHFHVRRIVGDEGVGLGLAAGAGGGRARRWRAASACGPCRSPCNRACVPPLVSRKLMPLAQSMALPPPTLTIRSMLQRPGEGDAGLDVVVGRVFLDVVEDEDLQARRPQRLARPAADARPFPGPDR